jgi:phosphoribosylglycinamide formyltransferase-1
MEALAEACAAGDVPGEVVAVVADRDCLGLRTADKLELEHQMVEPQSFGSRDEWSAGLRDVVLGYRPDLVVSAGFMRILAPVFVDAFPEKLINLHPALLPAFRGAHAVRDALDAGVKVTGSTIHFIDHQVDHGPIIMQEAVRIEQNDTEEMLHDRIKKVEHRLLPQVSRLFLEGKLRIEGGKVVVSDS